MWFLEPPFGTSAAVVTHAQIPRRTLHDSKNECSSIPADSGPARRDVERVDEQPRQSCGLGIRLASACSRSSLCSGTVDADTLRAFDGPDNSVVVTLP